MGLWFRCVPVPPSLVLCLRFQIPMSHPARRLSLLTSHPLHLRVFRTRFVHPPPPLLSPCTTPNFIARVSISDVCNWVSRLCPQHEHEALSFIPSHVYLKEALENACTRSGDRKADRYAISFGWLMNYWLPETVPDLHTHQGKYIVLPSKTL
jgi:hypothetical protein